MGQAESKKKGKGGSKNGSITNGELRHGLIDESGVLVGQLAESLDNLKNFLFGPGYHNSIFVLETLAEAKAILDEKAERLSTPAPSQKGKPQIECEPQMIFIVSDIAEAEQAPGLILSIRETNGKVHHLVLMPEIEMFFTEKLMVPNTEWTRQYFGQPNVVGDFFYVNGLLRTNSAEPDDVRQPLYLKTFEGHSHYGRRSHLSNIPAKQCLYTKSTPHYMSLSVPTTTRNRKSGEDKDPLFHQPWQEDGALQFWPTCSSDGLFAAATAENDESEDIAPLTTNDNEGHFAIMFYPSGLDPSLAIVTDTHIVRAVPVFNIHSPIRFEVRFLYDDENKTNWEGYKRTLINQESGFAIENIVSSTPKEHIFESLVLGLSRHGLFCTPEEFHGTDTADTGKKKKKEKTLKQRGLDGLGDSDMEVGTVTLLTPDGGSFEVEVGRSGLDCDLLCAMFNASPVFLKDGETGVFTPLGSARVGRVYTVHGKPLYDLGVGSAGRLNTPAKAVPNAQPKTAVRPVHSTPAPASSGSPGSWRTESAMQAVNEIMSDGGASALLKIVCQWDHMRSSGQLGKSAQYIRCLEAVGIATVDQLRSTPRSLLDRANIPIGLKNYLLSAV